MHIEAHAKINWTLDVLYKRADGYHELDSIMQPLTLCNELTVEKARALTIESDGALPPENNMKKAALLYFERTGLKGGAHITVKQHIPDEAGLGGASSDAAAVLSALHALYGGIERAELFELGARIGADVPFCLAGTLSRCQGVGEKLTSYKGKEFHLLLVKPDTGISTAALFNRLDIEQAAHMDAGAALEPLLAGDAIAAAPFIGNTLTPAACELVPEISEILAQLERHGALAASMTGSGSCCFGLFESRARAERAQQFFKSYGFARTAETI